MDTSQPILAIIGPSAAGKSSALIELARRGLLVITPTWTTRPPRPGEADTSLEHVFVSEEEFDCKDQAGFFIKTGQLFDLPYHFGLPTLATTTSAHLSTIVLRAPLIVEFKAVFTNTRVYQIIAPESSVYERLSARADAGETLGTRRQEYEQEVALGTRLADRTFVNDGALTTLVDDIARKVADDFGISLL